MPPKNTEKVIIELDAKFGRSLKAIGNFISKYEYMGRSVGKKAVGAVENLAMKDLVLDLAQKKLLSSLNNLKKANMDVILKNKELAYEKARILTANKREVLSHAKLRKQLKSLEVKYKNNILAAKQFNLQTTKATINFRKWFGVMLGSMFILQKISNMLNSFVQKSIKFYIEATGNNTVIAKSINGVSAAWNFLKYSFAQTMGELGIFDLLANLLNGITTWFQNLTPAQQKFIVFITVATGLLATLGGFILNIGIVLLSLQVPISATGATFGAAIAGMAGAFVGFAALLAILFYAILGNWDEVWGSIKKTYEDVLDNFKTYFKNITGGVKDIWDAFGKLFKGDWDDFWYLLLKGLAKVFLGTFDFIFNSLRSFLKGIIRVSIAGINSVIKMMNKLPFVNIKTLNSDKIISALSLNNPLNTTGWALNKLDKLFGRESTTEKKQVVNNIHVNLTYSGQMSQDPNSFASVIARQLGSELSRRGI